jgi:hypothetical protein
VAAEAERAALARNFHSLAENATVFRLERDAAEERASEFLAKIINAAEMRAASERAADEKAAAEKAAAERATVEKEAAERAAAAAAAEAASLRRRAKAETVAAERVADERAALARELHSLDEEATALRLPRDAASTQRSDYVRLAGSGMSAARRLLAAAAGRLLAASSSKISSTDRPDIRELSQPLLGPRREVLLRPVPAIDVRSVIALAYDPARVAFAKLGHVAQAGRRIVGDAESEVDFHMLSSSRRRALPKKLKSTSVSSGAMMTKSRFRRSLIRLSTSRLQASDRSHHMLVSV